jgi:hypothetical protein
MGARGCPGRPEAGLGGAVREAIADVRFQHYIPGKDLS